MSKRVTIMIDDDLDKKMRMLQAKMIQSTTSSVSFSNVLNQVLRESLKK
jgi:predicted transcriptional regulator